MLTFKSAAAARRFVRGYCVPRVAVQTRGGIQRKGAKRRAMFAVCHPATAKRHGWKVI